MAASLDDLRLLDAVARGRGFRRAAADLGCSPSSVSERVRALEAALGARLLNRTTRSVGLTEAGELLLERARPALAELEAAFESAGAPRGEVTGRLRINAPDAAEASLGPLIGPFLAEHPGVRMEVVLENAFTDVVGAGFDAGVRYGERLAQDMIAVPLGGPERYVLVAAPSLLARVGRPAEPEALTRLPCIRLRLPIGVLPWEFEQPRRTVRFVPDGPLLVTSAVMGLHAARAGVGFFVTFETWAAADIAAGRLESLLEHWLPPFEGPFLYYPNRRPSPPLAAFVAFLRRRERGSD